MQTETFLNRRFKQTLSVASLKVSFLMLLYFFVFFIIPFCLRLATEQQTGLKEIVIAFCVSAGMAALCELFPKSRRIHLMHFLGLFLFLGSLTASIFTISIASDVNRFTISAILDTNPSEALDFMSTFLDYKAGIILVLLTIPFCFLMIFRGSFSHPRSLSRFIIFSLIFLLPYPLMAIRNMKSQVVWKSLDYPIFIYIPFQPYSALIDALKYKRKLSAIGGHQDMPGIRKSNKAVPETIVVILGESLTRHRMGIYGYCRDTTPFLEREKDNLIIFSDFISSFPHTIPAVHAMLTPKEDSNYTIIDAFQKVGIPVWWISNQPRIGVFESDLSVLTESAEQHRWTNPNSGGNLMSIARSYDSNLLPAFEEALSYKGQKIIFLHMLGSHHSYDQRYPQGFSTNRLLQALPHLPGNIASQVQAYDMSVLYSDEIAHEILKLLQKRDALLIFTSDHGDEVYQFANFLGHGGDVLTPAMTDVPFIVWFSEQVGHQQEVIKRLRNAQNVHATLNSFFYILADLGGLEIPTLDQHNNPLSAVFYEKERYVRNMKYRDIRKAFSLDCPDYWCCH
ncbi:MAG: phosphoethanolamine transferase [Proteobacteria bacterium]|nr:phosphoethanolamine transferase [Pseudomonadota bacterium]